MPMIVPFTLRRLRNAKKWSLDDLADRAKVDRGTIWRLEKGEQDNPHESTINKLAGALGVEASVLMGKSAVPDIDDDRLYFMMSKLGFRISWQAYNSLYLAAHRYWNVSQQDIVELAPLLFCWAAETSLRERRKRLERAKQACESARRLTKMRHQDDADFSSSEEEIAAEEESIDRKDLFGASLDVDYYRSDNPFESFLRRVVDEVGNDAYLDSYKDFDHPFYYICADEVSLLADGDEELSDAILDGLIPLHEMPRDFRYYWEHKSERLEWLRGKLEEHRNYLRACTERAAEARS